MAWRYTEIPRGERIVSMIEYRGRVLVATETRVYESIGDPKTGEMCLSPLEILVAEETT